MLHGAVGTLAATLSSVFSAVFLIHVGLASVQIFLAFAAILALRFIIRPVVLIAAPAMGLRRALVLGTVLSSLSCPLLALVDGVGIALALFIAVSALAKCSTVPATTSSFPRLATPSAGGDRLD
jgi:hypothetical protein